MFQIIFPRSDFYKIVSVCTWNVHQLKECCRHGFVQTALICAVELNVLGFASPSCGAENTTLSWRNIPETMHTDLTSPASAGSHLRHHNLLSHSTQKIQKE